ncbi:MAG: ABC transporter ATP-binding protein [Bacteroidales bacterium]|jgi:peptide/nickel transport system ATP-binding protein|nr:ABC transporter ATP-binding protein [Bacteroidales bacterium]
MLIDIKNLEIGFKRNSEYKAVVDNISCSFNKGEILGVVGESGSGKSITALSILQLLPKTAIIFKGQIFYENNKGNQVDLLKLNNKEITNIRGKDISMIFQEPMSSLNPVMKCGRQLAEVLFLHTNKKKKYVKNKVINLFREVKLPSPKNIYNSYPHELSGGQRQRVMIAIAIACNPALLIADEPTTALDVLVQNSILELLKELQQKYGMSIIFITHDLAVISQIADKIIIMKDGKIVEGGDTKKIFNSPNHPYTKGLLNCRPTLQSNNYRLPVLSDFLEEKKNPNIK